MQTGEYGSDDRPPQYQQAVLDSPVTILPLLPTELKIEYG